MPWAGFSTNAENKRLTLLFQVKFHKSVQLYCKTGMQDKYIWMGVNGTQLAKATQAQSLKSNSQIALHQLVTDLYQQAVAI